MIGGIGVRTCRFWRGRRCWATKQVRGAEAYGHVGIKISKTEDLYPKLKDAFAMTDKLVFVDILVDPNEHVYPMAIKGGAMKDMVLSKTERT